MTPQEDELRATITELEDELSELQRIRLAELDEVNAALDIANDFLDDLLEAIDNLRLTARDIERAR